MNVFGWISRNNKINKIKQIKKEREKKKDKNKKGNRQRRTEKAWKRDKFYFYFFFFSLFLLQIYGNWTVDFYRSRRQSWTMRRELRIGTNILAFRQTSRGRKFSYLCYFEPKGYVMAWKFLRGRKFQSQNF